jgi:hypothetical protein
MTIKDILLALTSHPGPTSDRDIDKAVIFAAALEAQLTGGLSGRARGALANPPIPAFRSL